MERGWWKGVLVGIGGGSNSRTRRTWFSVAFAAGVEEKHRVEVVVVVVNGDDRGREVLAAATAGCRANDGIRYLRSGVAIVRVIYLFLRPLDGGLLCSDVDVVVLPDVEMREQIDNYGY